MANVKEAVDFVLRQEDSALSGVVTNAPADRGGLTRFGLTAKWHPELVASGFYKTNRDDALAIAEEVYSNEYIPHLDLGSINRTAVAIAILSFAVVEGAGQAVLTLQRVLKSLGYPLAQDGSVGPQTIAAINSADALQLVMGFVKAQRSYFQAIAANDSSQTKWLAGWNNRAIAILTYAQKALVQ